MANEPPFSVGMARPMRIDASRMAIPTQYAGVQFRSRLEARYAALFDILQWPWNYEPADLAHYLPDFVIRFSRAPLLLEVKPEMSLAELEPHAKKICRSGWRGSFLIVGGRPLTPGRDCAHRSFGLLGLWDRESDDGWCSADDAIAINCLQCGTVTMRHASAEWFCIGCGANEPRVHFEDCDAQYIDECWAEAGNRVQWRGPQAR